MVRYPTTTEKRGGGGGEVTGHFDTKLFRYKSFRYKFIHLRGVNSSTYLA